ncbi:ATP-dependent RecD-like DNA helicase (plasmid) [Shewanella xiamenensis]|uniref:ATP-dependent RecD-like DNA helicase n=1 Tax=Shewanella xiamenensis TaxID=332186 RepID=A0ABT6UH69_9GAMM|nr:ATP-dependent RecD-like DNA helicase [Shewanella xiamenensis]MDI5833322.1 ATP-dependent RecD-like DNA helicase [Shewanella xiamenensis]WHF57926.1 ATP-dependent RecD-like DNA helicase [Shewanella xiamenensis]
MTLLKQIERANRKGSTVIRLTSESEELTDPSITRHGDWCGLTSDIEDELEIIRHLSRLKGHSSYWITPSIPPHFDVEQSLAVSKFFKSKLVVLCGSGGAGKTTVLVQIVKSLLEANVAESEIAIISPLAVIASRLGSKCGIAGYTIHRLLGFKQHEDGVFEPLHDESRPLPQTFFIIDEATLVSNKLALALFRAIPTGARVLIAGDKKQLKGVGKGDVFESLTKLPESVAYVIELVNNYRHKGSGIERFAEQITSTGEPEEFSSFDDLKFSFTTSDEHTYEVLRKKLKKIGADGLRGVQILCPEHDGILGTKSLNSLAIQIVSIGERVMFTSNNYRWSLFNGQSGIIKSSNENMTTIEVMGRLFKIETESLWDVVEPAYALTPNRCQGAEFALVIMVIPHKRTHIDLCWTYACCTRAKQCLAIVGSESEFRKAIRFKEVRNTLMNEISKSCYL